MKGSTKLFRVFGIDIKLHFSWWFIFFLLAWSLSAAFFPNFFPGYSTTMYWIMGVVAAILLFISVLMHELSHSLVAKIKKIKVESITLFFFGGVASITKEDMKPSTELQMALAGPFFSLLLAGVFFLIFKSNLNGIISAITFYLYQINFILALFNLVPGYPLDGGRAFRAILYWHYKDLKKATRIAAMGGKFVAGFLVVVGIFGLFTGMAGGLWFVLLGGFLYFIAGMSYEQVVVREVLSEVPLSSILRKKYPVLNPGMKFTEFLQKYSHSEEEAFIVKNKSFTGILDLKRINKIPPKMRQLLRIKQVSLPLDQIKTVQKSDTAYEAFRRILEQNLEILPVMDKKKMVGIVSRKAVMNKMMLEMKFGNLLKKK